MTTLPQTQSRFPRPTNGVGASNGHPMPLAPLAGPAVPGSAPGGLTPADVFRVLRQNLIWIILITGLFLAAGYGVFYYLNQNHKEFQAIGLLRINNATAVDPVTGRVLETSSGRINIEIKQATEAALLKSDDLWSAVLSDTTYNVQDTAWYQNFVTGTRFNAAAAKADFEDRISINAIPESELVRVAVSAPSPDDARILTNALISTHVDRQSNNNSNNVRNLIADYNQQISSLSAEIGQIEARISSLSRGTGSEGNVDAQSLLAQQALQDLQRQRSTAIADLEAAKQASSAFNSQISRGLEPTEVQQAVEMDPEVQNLRQTVTGLEIQLEQLRERFGSGNQVVRDTELQLREFSARMEDKAAIVRSRVRDQLITVYGNATNSAQAIVDGIDEEIEILEERIASLTQRRTELAVATEQRDRKVEQRDSIQSYVSALRTTINRGGSVAIANTVQTPDMPSFPNRTVVMGAAGVLGLGLSLGLAFLRELTDTSVRSPRDISRVGQLSLLGMIPHEDDDPQAGTGPVSRAIEQSPGGIIAEGFRQLRSRFNYAAPLETTRTVMVTSCGPEDGKTSVATNLATSLALAGRRVLLVDANFRRPEIGGLYGIDTPGFAAALQTPGQLPNLVGATDVNGLSVLPAGEAMNTNELVESHHFIEFVDRALEDFDQVIFDAGPVMLVSESAAMAARVDGVITVVRAKENSRGVLQRLRDHLRQLRAEHIGVVLNGVRAQSGGYYARNIKTFYDYSKKSGK
ncbi:MAG: hypothetical protein AAGD32_01475 [Planctomycetota bacterium]